MRFYALDMGLEELQGKHILAEVLEEPPIKITHFPFIVEVDSGGGKPKVFVVFCL